MVHREYTRHFYLIEYFQGHLRASQRVTCPHFASLPEQAGKQCFVYSNCPNLEGFRALMFVCVLIRYL